MRQLIYLLLVVNLVYFGMHVIQDMTDTVEVRAAPSVPAGVKTLILLQEMELGDSTAGDTDNLDSLTRQDPPGAGAALRCKTLGPFAAIEKLRPLETSLLESGLHPTRRTTDENNITGYWVYLPIMPRATALAARDTLKEHKIRDFFIGKDNFISLGTFKHISRAERHAATIRKIGLEPQIKPRLKTRSQYWLDLDEAESQTADADILQEFPGIKLQALACP